MASMIDNSRVSIVLINIIIRIEKETPLTENVKWDGVAFLVKKRTVVPLLVDLSGGIDHNTGIEKAQGDELKGVRQVMKFLKIKKAEGSQLPRPMANLSVMWDKQKMFNSLLKYLL